MSDSSWMGGFRGGGGVGFLGSQNVKCGEYNLQIKVLNLIPPPRTG